jgi:hypothetical protein
MRRHLKRRLALIVALAAVLGGGTAVALAATGSHHTRRHHHAHRAHAHAAGTHARHGLLQTAASYLGVSASALRTQLGSGETLAQIAAATPGRSAAGLVAALTTAARQRLDERAAAVTPKIERLVNGQPAAHRRRTASRRLKLVSAVLAYLGIPRRQLVARLHSGQSLDQIAAATAGKSEAGLRSAVLAALEQRLHERTAAHGISKASEARRRKRLEERVTKILGHKAQRHGLRPARTG